MVVGSLVACEATTPIEEEEPPPVIEEPPPEEEEPPPVIAEPLPVIEESDIPGVMPPIQFQINDPSIQVIGGKLSRYSREFVFQSHWSPWTITIPKGYTMPFIVNASAINDMEHSFTIEGTEINVTLGPGEAEGPFEVTFDELGTYKVDCGLHPGEHGECMIVVEPPPGALDLPPVFFTLGNVDGAYLQVEGDDLAPFGSGHSSGQKGPWTLTITQGSNMEFHVEAAGRPGTEDHSLTIEGTDLDINVTGPGGRSDVHKLTFDDLGKFRIDCSLHPGEHGDCFVEVVEALVFLPISFKLADTYIKLEGEDLTSYGLTGTELDSPWTITVLKGTTIEIMQAYMGGNPTAAEHVFAIEGTDIEAALAPGGSEGPFEVTFDEVGTFEVYCKLRSADTYGGKCFIEVVETMPVEGEEPPVEGEEPPVEEEEPPVEEEEAPPPVAEGPLPPIFFTIGTDYIRLKGDDLATYGFTGAEVNPPWTLTIAQGSTITITDVTVSGRPGTGDHTFTIEGTDIDESIPQGTIVGPYEATFNEAGTFTVSCTLHDHGECLIVVVE